ncbi:MAG: glycosyltransferase family 2 protein [Candidatus Omnitrophica bacterium]|nr:glycosyltransferase family 2 protein [Candidatus Omnitrophota bacterium]
MSRIDDSGNRAFHASGLGSVSFVIPMYNEKHGIEATINKLIEIASGLTNDYEIIIADDGSTDGCNLIAGEIAAKNPRVRVIRLEKNTKFGGALKAGLQGAQKEIVIYTDSDLPIDIQDIKTAFLLLERADIVTAYSKIRKGETFTRIVMSKVYNFLIQFLFRTDIKDINSGFKIYRRKIFDGTKLISESPFIDVEIFVRAIRKRYAIEQYPVIFKHRQQGKSYISRPAVILKTISDMLKFRFIP